MKTDLLEKYTDIRRGRKFSGRQKRYDSSPLSEKKRDRTKNKVTQDLSQKAVPYRGESLVIKRQIFTLSLEIFKEGLVTTYQ